MLNPLPILLPSPSPPPFLNRSFPPAIRGGTRLVTGPDNKTDGRGSINGYGVFVYQSTHVWIDHCSFGPASDTQIDVIYGSTDITISNNYFYDQNKVSEGGSGVQVGLSLMV